eukprot:767409-Hanusia_phi.AAC.6
MSQHQLPEVAQSATKRLRALPARHLPRRHVGSAGGEGDALADVADHGGDERGVEAGGDVRVRLGGASGDERSRRALGPRVAEVDLAWGAGSILIVDKHVRVRFGDDGAPVAGLGGAVLRHAQSAGKGEEGKDDEKSSKHVWEQHISGMTTRRQRRQGCLLVGTDV